MMAPAWSPAKGMKGSAGPSKSRVGGPGATQRGSSTCTGAMRRSTGSWMSGMSPRWWASPTTAERKLLVTLKVLSTRWGSPHSATMYPFFTMMPEGSPRSRKGPTASPRGSRPKPRRWATARSLGVVLSASRAKEMAASRASGSMPRASGARVSQAPGGGTWRVSAATGGGAVPARATTSRVVIMSQSGEGGRRPRPSASWILSCEACHRPVQRTRWSRPAPFLPSLPDMALRPIRLVLPFLLLLTLAQTACEPADGGPDTDGDRRAILLSVDALHEGILRETLDETRVPALLGALDGGMCAEYAIPSFPSVTAASHSVMWTGAFGDVSLVTANSVPALPRGEHTVLESVRGFHYDAAAAEPLWITGGRTGVPVVSHHGTQAPGVPGYPAIDVERTEEQEARRAESAEALSQDFVQAMNGYNTSFGRSGVLRPDRELEPADVAEWSGLDVPEGAPEPRAWRWETDAGVVHFLLHGDADGYRTMSANVEPELDGAIHAHAEDVEAEPVEGRELARHFSDALALPVEGGRVFLYLRLFEVEEDGSDFVLFQPGFDLVETNRPDLQEAYDDAVRGWFGGSGFGTYSNGFLGTTVQDGGDGTAEARYLETAELHTRQFMRGSAFLWNEYEPRLMVDYFPLGDAIDHPLLGWLEEEWPGYDPEMAEALGDLRARTWALVDHRVEHLLSLAEEAGAALFLTGDHGMRTTWRIFRPNRLLEEAGLLVRDDEGQIDLSRTRAVAPNGYWISVNRTAWREGIVPPEEEAEVIQAVREALEGFEDEEGRPVVTRTLVPEEYPELGLGGPAGGDVYWSLAPGIRANASTAGQGPLEDTNMWTGHGFDSTEPDMHTVFCGVGGGFEAGRFDGVPLTVIAPTVAEYVGMEAPRDAVTGSVLSRMGLSAPPGSSP
ncbi:MAG: hypothetical protein EA352_07180 [Gemmatimonadales bacterium]|nr:MAG: hypothetical protein EA352_07180 [Gemmatimonadales bacterium]